MPKDALILRSSFSFFTKHWTTISAKYLHQRQKSLQKGFFVFRKFLMKKKEFFADRTNLKNDDPKNGFCLKLNGMFWSQAMNA
jgi:hypothetical protein